MDNELKPPSIAGDVLTIYVSHARLPRSPQGLLMKAVLEDGINQAIKVLRLQRITSKRDNIKEARKWIEDDDKIWPFSFLNCCDVFHLEPSRIRREVRRQIYDNEGMLL